MAAILLLGFASGLPLALSAGALQAWLTVSGVSLQAIGFFTLVGLPYTFKFVWAPLMDRFEPAVLGRRRGWLLLTQLALAGICVAMAQTDPAVPAQLQALGALAVGMAFLSASQDVVCDAYRSDLLDARERGAGAAVHVLGYRLAMIVSGGLALIVADPRLLGWPATYRLMALLFAGCALGTLLLVPRLGAAPATTGATATSAVAEWRGFAALVVAGGIVFLALRALGHAAPLAPLRADRWGALLLDSVALVAAMGAAVWAVRRVGFPSFVGPWDEFFGRPRALWLLAFIVLYKLGDAFAGALSTTFLLRGVGFEQAEVGVVNKVWGLAATIAGALFGGALLARVSLYRALMWFGIAQMASNAVYLLLAITPKHLATMTLAVAIENVCGGMGTAAFVAFLMALTDIRFSAAQYAMLSALAAAGRVYVGPASGVAVEAWGWPTFFAGTIVAAMPGLLVLAWLRRDVQALDVRRKVVEGAGDD